MASRGSNKTATRRRITVESSDGIDTCNRPSSHFPYKLYDMLEYAADSEFFYSVSWSEDGTSFAIHDKDEFMMHVVPLFFKQTKFRSFVSITYIMYHDVYYCNNILMSMTVYCTQLMPPRLLVMYSQSYRRVSLICGALHV